MFVNISLEQMRPNAVCQIASMYDIKDWSVPACCPDLLNTVSGLANKQENTTIVMHWIPPMFKHLNNLTVMWKTD